MKVNDWSKIKESTLLIITWIDIVSVDSWMPDDEAQSRQPSICKTVGWFVNDDEENIRLTMSVADDGDKNIFVLPKGVIKDVKKIRYKR